MFKATFFFTWDQTVPSHLSFPSPAVEPFTLLLLLLPSLGLSQLHPCLLLICTSLGFSKIQCILSDRSYWKGSHRIEYQEREFTVREAHGLTDWTDNNTPRKQPLFPTSSHGSFLSPLHSSFELKSPKRFSFVQTIWSGIKGNNLSLMSKQ